MRKYILSFFIIFIIYFPFINVKAEHSIQTNKKTKIAYLTFDDGPSKNTKKIIDILNNFDIKATFFVVGNRINDNNQYLLNDLILNGHYIGLHTMTHDYQRLYNNSNAHNIFLQEIIVEQQLIYKITGVKSSLVRPPYSDGRIFTNSHIEKIINSDFKSWDWNIDTKDWQSTNHLQVMNNVRNDLFRLGYPDTLVILFHELNVSVNSLPVVIVYLKYLGYEFACYDPNNHFPHNFKNNIHL